MCNSRPNLGTTTKPLSGSSPNKMDLDPSPAQTFIMLKAAVNRVGAKAKKHGGKMLRVSCHGYNYTRLCLINSAQPPPPPNSKHSSHPSSITSHSLSSSHAFRAHKLSLSSSFSSSLRPPSALPFDLSPPPIDHDVLVSSLSLSLDDVANVNYKD